MYEDACFLICSNIYEYQQVQPAHEECMTDTSVEKEFTTENMSQELIEQEDDDRFQRGLSVDPTIDSSDGVYEQPPLPDIVLAQIGIGECGVPFGVNMTPADGNHMLQVSR